MSCGQSRVRLLADDHVNELSPFQYLFNTSASRILDQNVMKTCSEGDETPKLVRSRYESDPKVDEMSSFVPTDYLPYNYDLNRRMQENRKTATRRGPKRDKYEEDQHRLNREGVDYDF